MDSLDPEETPGDWVCRVCKNAEVEVLHDDHAYHSDGGTGTREALVGRDGMGHGEVVGKVVFGVM